MSQKNHPNFVNFVRALESNDLDLALETIQPSWTSNETESAIRWALTMPNLSYACAVLQRVGDDRIQSLVPDDRLELAAMAITRSNKAALKALVKSWATADSTLVVKLAEHACSHGDHESLKVISEILVSPATSVTVLEWLNSDTIECSITAAVKANSPDCIQQLLDGLMPFKENPYDVFPPVFAVPAIEAVRQKRYECFKALILNVPNPESYKAVVRGAMGNHKDERAWGILVAAIVSKDLSPESD